MKLILSVFIGLLIIPVIIYANAETINLPIAPTTKNLNTGFFNDIVGISLSKTCIGQIISNRTVTCPSYDELIKLGYDHSSIRSGKFIIKNNFLQREFTKVKNESVYYLTLKNTTIVDPSYLLSIKIKTITIEPKIPSYLLTSDMIKNNNTRTIHKDRYVNPQCTQATISSDNWKKTLPDTILYLMNGCSGELTDTKYLVHDKITNTDITTSQKYKEDKFKQESKLNYKTISRIGTKDKTINKSVTEDRDPRYIPKIHPPFNYTGTK